MKLKSTFARQMLFLPLLAVCLALLIPSARAQFLWAQRIASTANWPSDEPDIGLVLDGQDNCYVTGFFDGTNNFGTITLTNQSPAGSDMFVAKYNASGSLQWVQRAGGTSGTTQNGHQGTSGYLNNGRGIGLDSGGNVYVSGGYYGAANFGGFILPASTNENFFLAKYNGSGTVQWVQTAANGSGIYGLGLVVDASGNSYALAEGYSAGTNIIFGTKVVPSPPGYEESSILVKYDTNGVAQWAQLLGATATNSENEVYASKLAVDGDGNVYVQGTFSESLTIVNSNLTVSSGSTADMFIAKFDQAGDLAWVQHPAGGNVGSGSVVVDPARNVYVSGSFDTNLVFSNGLTSIILTNRAGNTAPFGDAFLAKYNSSGTIQWAQSAGGTNGGFYWDFALDAQTNIYAAGFLGSYASIAKYNPADTNQWNYSAGGPSAKPVGSLVAKCAIDATGHLYLAGWYQNTATFGTNTLQPQETWNFFLTEVSSALAIARSGSSIILTWPTNATPVYLQSTTNLSAPVWTTVSATPVVINSLDTVTNSLSATRMFYRLQSP